MFAPAACSNSKAARRWHLAYTLLHNPDLLPRRKLAILLTRGMESGDDRKALPYSRVEMMPTRSSKRGIVRDGWTDNEDGSATKQAIGHSAARRYNPELPEVRIQGGTCAANTPDVEGYGSLLRVGVPNPSFQIGDENSSNPGAPSYI